MSHIKDFFLIVAGFAILQIIYFLQSDSLMVKIYFDQPLVIYVLSICCYVLFVLKGKGSTRGGEIFLSKNDRIKEDPENRNGQIA